MKGRPQYGVAPDHFIAWGLYFQEDYEMKRLVICGVVTFLISLIFGIVWATYRKSIQDGFTVASYILTFETLCIGTVQISIRSGWL
jgi:hypothetical protein